MTTMTSNTPAQQLEEVLSLHTHMVEVRRSGEEATAIQCQREFLCYAAEYVASHAPTLRRALAALAAVDEAIKVDVADNAWIGCVPHHLAGTSVLIIPTDAVEVSRG